MAFNTDYETFGAQPTLNLNATGVSTVVPQCPPGWIGTPPNCRPSGPVPGPGGPSPVPVPTPTPPPPAPTGPCPAGTPNGPASCCPAGTVWRNDTKKCEAPDERSRNDQDTCAPVPGSRWHGGAPGPNYWCDFDTMEWKVGFGGGANQGGAGGAGKSAAPPRPPADPGASQADVIWQAILKRLNSPSRYTPEVMSGLLGQTRLSAERQAATRLDEARAGLVHRNMLRAPFAAAAERGIRGDVYAQVLAMQNNIARAKIDADYNDKTAAIQEGMEWLNSLRQFVAQTSATAAQREIGLANINLGYARLAQEMEVLRESYQQKVQFCVLYPAACGEGGF